MIRKGERADSEARAESSFMMETDTETLYRLFRECGKVSTDSRSISGGEIFFALEGENFNGNEYALKALDSGAAYAVVSAGFFGGKLPEGKYKGRLIPVQDTLKALQQLARYHRSMTFVNGRPLPVIGLTGTNGKTTTKELITAVLSVRYNVTATEGNLNNSIGVPLTLLKIGSQTQIAVVEMGASHPGDIRELVSVALPDYGLITNVGKAHLLGFGSFEGVMKAKGELYDYIQRTADKVFINVDNPYLCRMASERPDLITIPYGVAYQGVSVLETSPEHPYLRMEIPDADGGEEATVTVDSHLVGAYNADNVMAAIAVGREFGVGLKEAVAAINAYIPANSRSQLIRTGRNTLIADAYNANPTSMAAAMDNFMSIDSGHKAMMLGDMLELGPDSFREHLEIVRKAAGTDMQVFLVGQEFRRALDMFRNEDKNGRTTLFMDFGTSGDLASWLAANPLDGYTVLVKGSRGMKMEKVLTVL